MRPFLLAVVVALALPAQASAVTDRDVRILGGALAAPGQFPWMAALTDASARRAIDGQFCGGTVVAPRVVLTAAHCVEDVTPPEVDVVVGRTRLSVESDGERADVTQIVRHPGWDAQEVVNDLALVQLARAVSVAPAVLPGPDEAAPGVRPIVSGWGATREGGSTSDDLRFVRLTVRSPGLCETLYDGFVRATQLCASANRSGLDSCQGDSGGPLFTGEAEAAHVLGIVSYGRGCGRGRTPGVYTDIAAFADWIAQNAAALNGDAPAPPPPENPPRVRIGAIACGATTCEIRLRVTGRPPAGGILLNVTRARTRGRKAVDRYFFARQDATGAWSGRTNLPLGRLTLYAFPLNAEQDDLDGDGDVTQIRVTLG